MSCAAWAPATADSFSGWDDMVGMEVDDEEYAGRQSLRAGKGIETTEGRGKWWCLCELKQGSGRQNRRTRTGKQMKRTLTSGQAPQFAPIRQAQQEGAAWRTGTR